MYILKNFKEEVIGEFMTMQEALDAAPTPSAFTITKRETMKQFVEDLTQRAAKLELEAKELADNARPWTLKEIDDALYVDKRIIV